MSNYSLRKSRVFQCMLFFTLIFGSLQFVPVVGGYLREIAIVMSGLFVAWLLVTRRSKRIGRFFTPFLRYISILVLLSLYSAWRAYDVFGQSFQLGFLANRGLFLLPACFVLLYAVKTNYIRLSEVESALVSLGWFSLIGYTLLNLLFDPRAFAEVAGFGYGSEATDRYGFIYETSFIVFCVIHYALKSISTRNFKYVPYALVHFGFILFIGERRLATVALLTSIIFFVWYRYKLGTFFLSLQIATGALIIGGLLGVVFLGFDFEFLVQRFSDAITVVTKGTLTDDHSANARIYEMELAMVHISENPILGNGRISNRWEWGYYTAVGGRFFPSDIGVFGALWVWGVFGFTVLVWQYYYVLRWYRQVRKYSFGGFGDTVFVYLIFMFLSSLAHAKIFLQPWVSITFISILGLIALQSHQNNIHRSNV